MKNLKSSNLIDWKATFSPITPKARRLVSRLVMSASRVFSANMDKGEALALVGARGKSQTKALHASLISSCLDAVYGTDLAAFQTFGQRREDKIHQGFSSKAGKQSARRSLKKVLSAAILARTGQTVAVKITVPGKAKAGAERKPSSLKIAVPEPISHIEAAKKQADSLVKKLDYDVAGLVLLALTGEGLAEKTSDNSGIAEQAEQARANDKARKEQEALTYREAMRRRTAKLRQLAAKELMAG